MIVQKYMNIKFIESLACNNYIILFDEELFKTTFKYFLDPVVTVVYILKK